MTDYCSQEPGSKRPAVRRSVVPTDWVPFLFTKKLSANESFKTQAPSSRAQIVEGIA
jgi:hypothetical protein